MQSASLPKYGAGSAMKKNPIKTIRRVCLALQLGVAIPLRERLGIAKEDTGAQGEALFARHSYIRHADESQTWKRKRAALKRLGGLAPSFYANKSAAAGRSRAHTAGRRPCPYNTRRERTVHIHGEGIREKRAAAAAGSHGSVKARVCKNAGARRRAVDIFIVVGGISAVPRQDNNAAEGEAR